MRLTNLGWRNPQESSAEFRQPILVTKEGVDLNYVKTRSSSTKRTTFPQERRFKNFGADFCGPGRYFPEENFRVHD